MKKKKKKEVSNKLKIISNKPDHVQMIRIISSHQLFPSGYEISLWN
jgi:hypothetical protein